MKFLYKTSIFLFFTVLAFAFTHFTSAQVVDSTVSISTPRKGSDSAQKSGGNVRFNRFANTTLLTGNVAFDRTIMGIGIRLIEGYRSSVVSSSQSARGAVQDNQNFSLLAHIPLLSSLNAVVDASSILAADNQQLALSNVSSNLVRAGIQYLPSSWFSIGSTFGIRWDQQLGMKNEGPTYSLAAEVEDLTVNGYAFHANANLSNDFIKPRHWATAGGEFAVAKNFAFASDSLHIQLLRMKREFYFPADSFVSREFATQNNIETRIEDGIAASNNFIFSLSPSSLLIVRGSLINRSISRDTRYKLPQSAPSNLFSTEVQEFHLQGSTGVTFTKPWLSGSIELSYLERDELHSVHSNAQFPQALYEMRTVEETRKNNITRQTRLEGRFSIPLGTSTHLFFSGLQNALRYDTPSKENIDDRDELMTFITVGFIHQFTPSFTITLPIDLSVVHTVYLSSQRSANNNWNRVLKFRPTAMTRIDDGIVNKVAAEVLANYTVYDFEEQIFFVKSFLFRQMTLADSVSVDLTRSIALNGYGQFRRYEQGELRWKSFTEIQTSDVLEKLIVLGLHAHLSEIADASIGYRYFSRTEYHLNGTAKNLAVFIRSAGPTLSARIATEIGTVQLSGWYERQMTSGGSSISRIVPNIDLRVEWKW